MIKNYNDMKIPIDFVCLTCCTCKRPKMLEKSLNSIKELIIPQNIRVEILVVDNDSEKSAEKTVEKIKQELNIPIHYKIEIERGISNARNKALEEVLELGASHILFFDDDEILDRNCLIEHINLYQNNKDTVISTGPTINKFIDKLPSYITKHLVFKQKTSKRTGQIIDHSACGNVFFPVSLIKDYNLRFSNEYVFMGGEDGDFFKKASALGFTIVWNNKAIIYEMVSKSRGNINWILKKCYYNGYAGTMLKIKNEKDNIKKFFIMSRQICVLIINSIILIPSIIFGLTNFLNILGIIIRTKGKIDAIIKTKPIDFYRNIYGE